MVSQIHRSFIQELARYERLLEVGIGVRDDLAVALRERGRTVVAIDVAAGAVTRDGPSAEDDRKARESARTKSDIRRADVVALARADDPLAALDAAPTIREADPDPQRSGGRGAIRGRSNGIDAVYARNLPAELQQPTVTLAERLDAACLFTTLGFEQPVVPVRRLTRPGTTLYLARGPRNGAHTDH
ncbi:UPF0146 family protein [Halorubrum vacuolatum]|uniref:Uncharacterized protein, UPF0146 family n=1 Tax=Halorubrum vacuolatum TaxID=63740 RepID=A0A238VML0_HALVU|nr:UPF0146 family protein [Halorubrum vacuolatum]SNR35466.1 Uncharacterized protein, UPF0146 family [Halorubrum vacuolatum]